MPEEPRINFDHYVAQHYIKRFSNDAGAVYVGKIKDRTVTETTDISRIMGEINWSVAQEVEDSFTAVEGAVARAFTRIQSDPMAIEGLALSTRRGLADFIIIHHGRSTGIHNMMNSSTEQMASVLEGMAPEGFDVNSLGLRASTRQETLQLGMSVGVDFEPVFQMKGCVALKPSTGKEFILGDNPFVSLTTQQEFYMRGAIFADQTYFWLPLNPYLGLFMGTGVGNKLMEGKIKVGTASEKLTDILNRAESYLAVDYIVGSKRGLIRNKLRIPNIGNNRSEVSQFGFSPLIFNVNNSYLQIESDVIDALKQQFS